MVVRFFFLQANYRSTVDFSNEALQAAEKGFNRLMNAIETLENIEVSPNSTVQVEELVKKTNESMNDDFNTPVAIANLFDGVKIINNLKAAKEKITAADLEKLKQLYHQYIFDIFGLQKEENATSDNYLNDMMNLIIDIRKEAKASKNYAMADLIRDELKKLNIQIQDTKDGATWTLEK